MYPTGSQRLGEYLTVGEAAQFLGVSTWTLRNWDRTGKLTPLRHPKNGYRIYRHEDLEAVLSPDRLGRPNGRLAPYLNWSEIGPREHFVQFYEDQSFLVDSVSGFIGSSLTAGDS